MAEIFRRVEKKYIINKEQYEKLLPRLKEYMNDDQYGKSTICNLYFDSEQYDLIRHSITKPYFKEKVRLRSYNTPNKDSKVYLEIKRKCNKVVGKRRIEMTLNDFKKYLNNPKDLEHSNKQIKKELDYCFKFYNLKPSMYLSYERVAYYQKDNMDFRVTFDNNILARNYEFDLDKGSYGKSILKKGYYIMEVKTLGAIPLWFVNLINEIGIKPGNFSKYGEAYEQLIMGKDTNKVSAYVFQEERLECEQANVAYAI